MVDYILITGINWFNSHPLLYFFMINLTRHIHLMTIQITHDVVTGAHSVNSRVCQGGTQHMPPFSLCSECVLGGSGISDAL